MAKLKIPRALHADPVFELINEKPSPVSKVKTQEARRDDDHFHGAWKTGGGGRGAPATAGQVKSAAQGQMRGANAKVVTKAWQDPPPPVGKAKSGAKAGGYSSDAAFGTNTSLGRAGEAAFVKITSGGILHPPGKGEQSPLDVRVNGYGFEVKAVSRLSTGYKATPKKYEIGQKEAAARQMGVKPALAIVVMDTQTNTAHAYWRPSLQPGRLSKNTGWNYLGSASLTASQVGQIREAQQAYLEERRSSDDDHFYGAYAYNAASGRSHARTGSMIARSDLRRRTQPQTGSQELSDNEWASQPRMEPGDVLTTLGSVQRGDYVRVIAEQVKTSPMGSASRHYRKVAGKLLNVPTDPVSKIKIKTGSMRTEQFDLSLVRWAEVQPNQRRMMERRNDDDHFHGAWRGGSGGGRGPDAAKRARSAGPKRTLTSLHEDEARKRTPPDRRQLIDQMNDTMPDDTVDVEYTVTRRGGKFGKIVNGEIVHEERPTTTDSFAIRNGLVVKRSHDYVNPVVSIKTDDRYVQLSPNMILSYNVRGRGVHSKNWERMKGAADAGSKVREAMARRDDDEWIPYRHATGGGRGGTGGRAAGAGPKPNSLEAKGTILLHRDLQAHNRVIAEQERTRDALLAQGDQLKARAMQRAIDSEIAKADKIAIELQKRDARDAAEFDPILNTSQLPDEAWGPDKPLVLNTKKGEFSPDLPEDHPLTGKGSEKPLKTPVQLRDDGKQPEAEMLNASGVNTTYRGKLTDGTEVYIKPASGLDRRSLRPGVMDPGRDFHNELAAQLVNERLKFVRMPEVAVRDLPGFGASMVSTAVPGKTANHREQVKLWQGIDPSEARQMAVFDTVIGNFDRHPGNWTVDGNKTYAIDHGMAFPTRQAPQAMNSWALDQSWMDAQKQTGLGASPKLHPLERAKLEQFYADRDAVTPALAPLVGTEAVNLMWQRVDRILGDDGLPDPRDIEAGMWP